MPINEKIRADEVMLIDDSGEKLGIVMIEEALDKAKAKNIDLDIVISSPSKRTKETLKHFFSNNAPQIDYEKSLYHAHLDDILSVVTISIEEINSIMIVGHNPSMHEVTEYLSADFIPKYPTCGLACLTYEGDWKDLRSSCCELEFFKMPRELR